MAHYATLNEYRFNADADDIRGAILYGRNGEKIAKIDDVVFDHQSGDIQYFVAKSDKGRRVLVPLNRVYQSTVDEDSFSSDLTAGDLDRLPEFDEKSLHNDDRWKELKQRHDESLQQIEKNAERTFENAYVEDPVAHRADDPSRIITPEPSEMPAGATAAEDLAEDYDPDLTPERLSPLFSGTANTSDKLNMAPHTESLRDTRTANSPERLGERFDRFAGCVRRDAGWIPTGCSVCDSVRRVA